MRTSKIAPTREAALAQLQIIYWRDIPASVQVRRGRREKAVRELPQRFADAIDMAAMKAGMAGTDDYLNEWRRADPVEVGDDLDAEADGAVAALDGEYPKERVVAIVHNKGLEQ